MGVGGVSPSQSDPGLSLSLSRAKPARKGLRGGIVRAMSLIIQGVRHRLLERQALTAFPPTPLYAPSIIKFPISRVFGNLRGLIWIK